VIVQKMDRYVLYLIADRILLQKVILQYETSGEVLRGNQLFSFLGVLLLALMAHQRDLERQILNKWKFDAPNLHRAR